jgi:hypothetical protein
MKFTPLKSRISTGTFLTLTCTTILILLRITGIDFFQGTKIIFALATQWVPGVYFWHFLSKKPMSIFLGIGIGSVFGVSFSILSLIITKTLLGINWGWLVPFLIWIFIVGINKVKKKSIKIKLKPIDSNEVKWLLLGLLPGMLYLIGWWFRNPTDWKGKHNFYLDLPYNEAIQNSVSIFWPPQNLMSSGSGLQYHWFSHLWAGGISEVLNLQSFVAQTRLIPVFVLISLGYLTYAFCRENLINQKISAGATAVSTGGIAISNLNGGNYEKSPSLFLSLLLILGFFYLIANYEELRTRSISYLYFSTAFLVFMTAIGTKGSSGPILLSGITLALAYNLLTRRVNRIFALLTFCTYSIGFLFMFEVLFQGAANLNFGFHLNWLALISTASSLFIGLLGSKPTDIQCTKFYFMLGCSISGSLLSMLFWNKDGAQNYFIVQSAVVAIVPIFKGFQIAIETLQKKSKSAKFSLKGRLSISIIMSFVIFQTLWILGENNDNKTLRGISAVTTLLIPILLTFLWDLKFKIDQIIVVSISALLIGTFFQSGRTFINDIQEKAGNSRNFATESSTSYSAAFETDYLQAGKWAKENIKKNQIIITTRQCLIANAQIDFCDKRWFLASALTGRQIYNEGSTFNSKNKNINTSFSDREDLSSEIAMNSSLKLIERLRSLGIEYIWFDKQVPHNENISTYLRTVYENQAVWIFKI